MLVSEAIQDIRNRINDREGVGDFENDQLISFINQAITYLGGYFTTAGNPVQTKTVTVSEGATVPTDFIKTAGTFPMKITGNVINLFNPKKDLKFKYFYENAKVAALTDNLPYGDANSALVIVLLAVIFALNQQRFDIQQDNAIQAKLMDVLNQAYGFASTGKQ